MQNSTGYVLVPWNLDWLFHNVIKPWNQSRETWLLALTSPVTLCGGQLWIASIISILLSSAQQHPKFFSYEIPADWSYHQL